MSVREAALQRRSAAIASAVEGEIEALAASGGELPTLVRLRTAQGTEIVGFNPGSSAVLRMSTSDAPLTRRQIRAAHLLERDFLVEVSSQSNAAAIEQWLQTSLKATASQNEDRQFGRLMRTGKTTKSPPTLNHAKFEAAHRIGWIKLQMNAVSWAMVEMLVRYEMGPTEIARQTGYSREYVSGRCREALSELAATIDAYVAMEGYALETEGDEA